MVLTRTGKIMVLTRTGKIMVLEQVLTELLAVLELGVDVAVHCGDPVDEPLHLVLRHL